MDSRKVAQVQALILGSAVSGFCQVDTGNETAKLKSRCFFKCCERKDSLSKPAFIQATVEASKETPLAFCGNVLTCPVILDSNFCMFC